MGEGTSGGPAAPSDFDAFWQVYPRREARGEAVKVWPKALSKAPAAVIVAGAQRYADDPNREPTFTAHPATWLNHERWNDDPQPPRNGNGHAPRDRVAEALAHARANPL